MYITRQHRSPAYACICICMFHMVHHITYITRQHKGTSIQLVAPVHVTYACKYTQGHPLRSQGPAQKRKDTRIEFVVLVHGGRRDVIRPAPHVDLYTHSRRLGMSNLVSHMHFSSPRLLASLYSEAWLPPFASLALLLKCMHARMSVCISQRPGQRRASLRSPSCSGPGARRSAAR